MLPTFNVITCLWCGRSFVAPSPRSRVCDDCKRQRHLETDAARKARRCVK